VTVEQIGLISLLVVVLVLFIWGRWRYDLVAIGAMLAVALSGIIPPEGIFQGFGHPATITVAIVLVISRGLLNSGVIDILSERALRAYRSTSLEIGASSTLAATLSAVMNNVGALALLMPAVIRTAVKEKRPPAMVLMPLSFASILGGMVTLIGTPPNIIIAAMRAETAGEPFGMFDFTPVGGVVAIVGVVFVSFVGWRLIPRERRARTDSAALFRIDDYVAEAVVTEGNPLAERRIDEAVKEAEEKEVEVLGVVRNGRRQDLRAGGRLLRDDDVLLLQGAPDALEKLVSDWKLETGGVTPDGERPSNLCLTEVVVPSGSPARGRSVKSLRLRDRYDVNVVAVSRADKPYRGRLSAFSFRTGDIVLLEGDPEKLPEAIADLEFLPLQQRYLRVGRPRRAALAAGLFLTAISLSVVGWLSLPVALGLAALAMVLSGLVPVREMYTHIDWPVIVLLGAMIPVGQALTVTGTTDQVASAIVSMSTGLPPMVLLGVILIVTMTLSDVINNAATAIMMGPIAIQVATRLDLNPDAFLMAVAVGASSAFLTPIGHQNNALVMGAGGYRFGDYWRMGLPLEILIVLVAVPLLTIVWPL
jgi:di/tricarboxylate transporter